MSKLIVDRLEVVNIQERKADRVSVPNRSESVFKFVFERLSVGHSSEIVVFDQPLHTLHFAAVFTHIPEPHHNLLVRNGRNPVLIRTNPAHLGFHLEQVNLVFPSEQCALI